MFSVGWMRLRRGTIANRARVTVAALVSLALGACADNLPGPREGSMMPTGSSIGQPIGAMLFCTTHGEECADNPAPEVRVALTDEAWRELRTVQYNVDADIAPRNPTMVAWGYAANGTGSCVQYAMEKRRALIEMGWPASSLRLVTATTRGGLGHLVLVANTTQGDFVLDNLSRDVTPWQDLSYRWGAIQTDASLRHWAVAAPPNGLDSVGNIVVTLRGPMAKAVQTAQASVPAAPPSLQASEMRSPPPLAPITTLSGPLQARPGQALKGEPVSDHVLEESAATIPRVSAPLLQVSELR